MKWIRVLIWTLAIPFGTFGSPLGAAAAKDTTRSLVHINYANFCTGCLQNFSSYIDFAAKSGIQVDLFLFGLEEQYQEEFLKDELGLMGTEGYRLLSEAEFESLNLKPSAEHRVYFFHQNTLLGSESCNAYLGEGNFSTAAQSSAPVIDSVHIQGDFSGLRYRSILVHKIGEKDMLIQGLGHQTALERYSFGETLKKENLVDSLYSKLPQFYQVYFGQKEWRKSYQTRNGVVNSTGKLFGKYDITIRSVQVEESGTFVMCSLYLLTADSSLVHTSLFVQYAKGEMINYWIETEKSNSSNYVLLSGLCERFLIEGDSAYFPVYNPQKDYNEKLYNLGKYSLGKDHQLNLIAIQSFFEPAEKKELLSSNSNNFFSDRAIWRQDGELRVAYDLMPFVYDSTNEVVDTLHLYSKNWFLEPGMKTVKRKIREGNFDLPYMQQVFKNGNQWIVSANEFGDRTITAYDTNWNLLHKAVFKGQAETFYPYVFDGKLVYTKRFGAKKETLYIYEMDLDQLFKD